MAKIIIDEAPKSLMDCPFCITQMVKPRGCMIDPETSCMSYDKDGEYKKGNRRYSFCFKHCRILKEK